jgi:PASTA domain
MRVTSGRAATAAMLLVGLAVLAVAGRLPPSAPSTQHPATTAAIRATTTPAIRTAPGNTRGYGVPDALGRTLAQAERVMRTAGLYGVAHERDPQGRNAVAQEPPAGVLVPPGSVVGFRTRTGVQPTGAPRRLRLGRGAATAAYRIVAPDPGTHQLTVAVVVPRATDVNVWLETGRGSRVPVLGSTGDAAWCRPGHGRIRCVVRLGVPAQGVWTVSVAKRSSSPAAIEITVTFTPL